MASASGLDADLLARGMPDAVASLVTRIRGADAVLIATPEYNFSVPGMLKNALDWMSRAEDQPFRRKPVAILSAATGPLGGARVQYELRKILLFLDALVLTKPEIFIGHLGRPHAYVQTELVKKQPLDVHGRPRFAKLSVCERHGGEDCTRTSGLFARALAVPDGFCWLAPQSFSALQGALSRAGYANHGLTCYAITA